MPYWACAADDGFVVAVRVNVLVVWSINLISTNYAAIDTTVQQSDA